MLRTPPPDQQIPVLETPRLRLRAQTLADFPASCALWSEPAVTRFTTMKPSSPEETWARMLRYAGHWTLFGFGTWLVEEKTTGTFVGEVGLFDYHRALLFPDGTTRPFTIPEIGWILSPAMHGRGYATEAVTACLDWAHGRFTATEIACIIHPDNAPSRNVAAKLGFIQRETVTYRDAPALLLTRPLDA
jgi:RimJ/RimL family protein N-acetyltransferase